MIQSVSSTRTSTQRCFFDKMYGKTTLRVRQYKIEPGLLIFGEFGFITLKLVISSLISCHNIYPKKAKISPIK